MPFQKVNSLGRGELTVTGRGGGIRQPPSWDGDTPPLPLAEGGVLGTLCATPVPTRGAGKRHSRAPGELERLSKDGRVATLEQVPGSRPAASSQVDKQRRVSPDLRPSLPSRQPLVSALLLQC